MADLSTALSTGFGQKILGTILKFMHCRNISKLSDEFLILYRPFKNWPFLLHLWLTPTVLFQTTLIYLHRIYSLEISNSMAFTISKTRLPYPPYQSSLRHRTTPCPPPLINSRWFFLYITRSFNKIIFFFLLQNWKFHVWRPKPVWIFDTTSSFYILIWIGDIEHEFLANYAMELSELPWKYLNV